MASLRFNCNRHWHNFLRVIWHTDATSCSTGHKTLRVPLRPLDQFFCCLPQPADLENLAASQSEAVQLQAFGNRLADAPTVRRQAPGNGDPVAPTHQLTARCTGQPRYIVPATSRWRTLNNRPKA